ALINKSVALLGSKQPDASVIVSDELINAYDDSDLLELHRYVSKALINKADALAEKGLLTSLRIYDDVVYRYSHIGDSALDEIVAMALVKKGNHFTNVQQATNAYDRVISDYGQSKDVAVQEQ